MRSDEHVTREMLVKRIGANARKRRLDASDEFVSAHILWFARWFHGTITTGQLIGRTGVKFKPRDGG